MTAPIGVGVIGLGFMGLRHIDAYLAAAAHGIPCRLLAVCDAQPGRWNDALETRPAAIDVRSCTDPAALLADPAIDLISICTYTDSHVPLAVAALEDGKHVLVEKPVALHAPDIAPLADAARRARTLCMPAMCIRFWPGWDWLHDRIADGSFGKVRSARLERLGSPPAWAPHFYADHARSGGALVDLHIHDADFLYWCFGPPSSVTTHGSLGHMTTLYTYAGAPAHASAEGGWGLHHSAGFRMRYTVAFEGATADYDAARPSPLMLHTDAGSHPVPLPEGTGYDHEIRALLHAITTGARTPPCSIADALAVASILDAERRSLESRSAVKL